MRQLWRVVAFFVALHKQEYTGQTVISWKEGVPQHTKTESSRTPDELPGDDEGLLELIQRAQEDVA